MYIHDTCVYLGAIDDQRTFHFVRSQWFQEPSRNQKPSWILVATRTLMKNFQKLFPRENLALSYSGVMHPFLNSEIFKTVFLLSFSHSFRSAELFSQIRLRTCFRRNLVTEPNP